MGNLCCKENNFNQEHEPKTHSVRYYCRRGIHFIELNQCRCNIGKDHTTTTNGICGACSLR
jgi:hypothetical protein